MSKFVSGNVSKRKKVTFQLSLALLASVAIYLSPLNIDVLSAKSSNQSAINQIVKFNIKSQSLSQALVLFGKQSGLQVSLDAALVTDLSTKGIVGGYTPENALDQLLSGTDLTHDVSGSKTVVIFKVATTQDVSDDPTAIQLDSIIVTADRREEEAFEVPISIKVIDSRTIEERQYDNTDELIRAVPNTHISQLRGSLGETNFSIRGVGTTAINVDQAIGFYVDNIPVASISEFGLEYFDIERVEVLRGPQGTLYGRNALGGVFHIITADPKDDNEAKAIASFGSDNEKRFYAMVNTQLGSDKLLARMNFLHTSRDARIKNLATNGAADVDDMELTAGRAKILFRPNDNLNLLFSGDISDSEQTVGTGEFLTATAQGVDTLRPTLLTKRSAGLSLKADYNFENLKLISLSSWRNQKQKGNGSRPEANNFNPLIPATVVFNNDSTGSLDQDTLTQELRLESSGDGPLKWIAGLYFQYNEADRVSDLVNVSTNIFERSLATTKDRSMAAFTDISYDLNDKFSLTAGVRATLDKKELEYSHVGTFTPLIGFSFAPEQALSQDKNFNDISPRFVAEYKLTQDLNLYAKATRGYKAGGFNTEFLGANNHAYDKENIWSYEAGIKTRWFDGKLEFDANIFHMDWENQQVLLFYTTFSEVANANKSRSRGVELEMRAKPFEGLQLTGSIGYVDAEFIDAPNVLPGGLNAVGNLQPNTPEWTAAFGIRYETMLSNDVKGIIGADISMQSSFYWDVSNTLEESSHVFVNLNGGIEYKKFAISLFAKNVFNEEYRVGATPGVTGFFTSQAQPGHGREVGIKGAIKF